MRASRGVAGLALFTIMLVACDTDSNVEPIFENYFIKTFGSHGDQTGVDIIVNADETITMLGNTIKPSGEHKMYFVKTDFEGKIIAEKELGDASENAMDIEPTASGFIILSNVTVDPNRCKRTTGCYDMKLLRVDTEGGVIDSVVFAGLNDQYGNSVTVVSDGRFFVIGKTSDTDVDANTDLNIEDKEDLLIVEFDNSFSTLNTFRIGRSSDGLGVKIYETPQGFTYAGSSDEIETGDVYNTNFIFRSFITDPRSVPTLYVGNDVAREEMSSFVKMPNGSFYGIGTEISSTGVTDLFITNVVNSQGVPVEIFSKNVGTDRLEGISGYPSINGSSIFILSNEHNQADNTRNIRLTEVNAFTGEELWSRQFGSTGNDDKGSALAELPNGDIVMTGTVNLINQQKLVLIKVNKEGKFSP